MNSHTSNIINHYIWELVVQIIINIKNLVLLFSLTVLLGCLGLFWSCSSNDDNVIVKDKTLATIENMGEVHNYLLGQMKFAEKTAKISDKTLMKDLIKNFQTLNADGKYYYHEVMTRTSAEISDFSEFENLEIGNFDLDELRFLILKRIAANKDIDAEVKKALEVISDPLGNPLSDKNLLLIETNKDKQGGNLLVVFKYIAESSNVYWASTSTWSAQSRAVIIADGIGGVLGTACSGVMGIIWVNV